MQARFVVGIAGSMVLLGVVACSAAKDEGVAESHSYIMAATEDASDGGATPEPDEVGDGNSAPLPHRVTRPG